MLVVVCTVGSTGKVCEISWVALFGGGSWNEFFSLSFVYPFMFHVKLACLAAS